MPDVATSLHLHNFHELMILAPVRQGFVEQDERRVSYSTRLKALLNLLFRPSQSTAERTLMPTLNFSEDLRNLYHFDYGVVDRLQQSQLILNATFDSSWEMYFHNLVDKVGPFLDAVFFHCEGFEGRSCADGYEKFADFIREHQVQTGMLYSAAPELTADDLRLLRRSRGESVKTPLLPMKEQIAEDKKAWKLRHEHKAWQGEVEYSKLRLQSITQFFLSVWETRGLFTPHEKVGGRSAQEFFDNAARFLASAVVGEVVVDAKGAISTVEIDEKPLPFATLTQLLLGDEKDVECVRWLEGVLKPEATRPADAPIDVSKLPNAKNVQSGILEQRESNSALLSFLRLPKKDVATFLKLLCDGIAPNPNAKMTVNAAFTFAGLRRLGVGDETCELFPKEFQEGMDQRAGVLGDIGWPSHPDYWRPIGLHGWFSISSIDLVVVFHFENADGEAAILKDARALLRRWIGEEHDDCLVHSEFVDRPAVDPFGFRARDKDRQSQPEVHPTKRISNEAKDAPYDNRIAPGNLILGYCDHRGATADFASGDAPSCDLFKDGTFLVVRKLAQNQRAFRRLQGNTQDEAFEEATLGKHVGDDRSYEKPPENGYHSNSHLRRSNPRFKDVPRIVRQSYTYVGGKDGDRDSPKSDEQGHMFMCYCASIAEQFEVIQRWINGGNSTGFLSSKRDALASQHASLEKPPAGEDPHVPAVTLRWGMYLFVPSKSALGRLAEVAERRQTGFLPLLKRAEHAREARRGDALLKQLRAIADPKVAQQSWKQLFEEAAYARDARAIWAAIRERGGRLDTPYGVLLGKRDLVKEVLENKGELYSVREYRERFLNTAGDFYLGLDECPAGRSGELAPGLASYTELAQANVVANAVLSTKAAHERAARFTLDFLQRNDRGRFDVKELVKHVIGKLCAEFTGVPSSVGGPLINDEKPAEKDKALRDFLNNFVAITRYSSFPYPEKWVAERAGLAGTRLIREYGADPNTWTGKLKEELQRRQYGSPQAIRDAIIIANVGFVPPAISMLTGMLSKWLNNGDIQQPRLRDDAGARSAILHEMKSDATFTTIYRTKVTSDCNGEPSPGKYVVVGVQSAYVEDEQSGAADPQRWMFGGTYAEPTPQASRGAHACPMQTQALEIIIGVTTTLAEHVHARAKEDCALLRLSPFTYQFDKCGRRLPGAYTSPSEVVAEKGGASAPSATSSQLTITSELEPPTES